MIRSLILVLVAVVSLAGCATRQTDESFTLRVREVLRDNPEMVLEALGNDPVAVLELAETGAKERAAREARQKFLDKMADPLEPSIDASRPMLGEADAPITVVAYTDFLCGYCARGAKDMKELMRRHPGKIRYIAKHVPMSETGELAATLFEALALQDQALAWEFYMQAFAAHDELRTSEDQRGEFLKLAKSLPGVDPARLDVDVNDERLAGFVRDDFLEFQSYGFRGVPVYLYNGAPLEGSMPMSFLEDVVAAILEKEQPEKGFTAEDVGGSCLDCLDKE